MYFMIILLWALALAYSVLILVYRYWFKKLTIYQPNESMVPHTFFSIVIPARNEAFVIGACLEAIAQQQYPSSLYEVIVVNDHSEDDTATEVMKFAHSIKNLQVIHLEDHLQGSRINSYKKKAIEIAVAQAKGNWIITTDADCKAQPYWLSLLDAYIQIKEPVFVAAPVMFTDRPSIIARFQLLDFLSLQGITAAAVAAGYHSMCNGANLAYSREAFYAVDQFKGIDHLASGDDMLLMYKMKKKFPGKIGFLFNKGAIVLTEPMDNWYAFLQQRIRWASKADSYADKSIFYVLLLVYLFNALLLVSWVAGIWRVSFIYHGLSVLLFKTSIELFFLIPVANFFTISNRLFAFPLFQPMHVCYTLIAGWLGKFGTYEWKQRKVS
jgi:cellulose synthase/poly-beta-1,6-N-acetylglucosamine synthase-like glycosyltransferase